MLGGAFGCGNDPVEPPVSTCTPDGLAGAPLTSLRGYIVFIAGGQLGAVCPDGSDLRTSLGSVTDTGQRFRMEPSPDGRTILISYGSLAGFDLFDVAAGTLSRLDLPTVAEGHSHADATWSPDGRSIAYVVDGDGIAVGDIAGTAVTNVRILLPPAPPIPPRQAFADLSWSPSGDRIAFVSVNAHFYAGDILLLDTLSRQLTGVRPLEQVYLVRGPVWSPDGNRFAFEVGGYPGQTWVSRTDGSEPVALTSGTPPPFEFSLSWSPDGDEVALVRGGDLWIVPAAGGPGREVAHLPQPGIRQARWVH
jgi:Tol biopolymer transport system component